MKVWLSKYTFLINSTAKNWLLKEQSRKVGLEQKQIDVNGSWIVLHLKSPFLLKIKNEKKMIKKKRKKSKYVLLSLWVEDKVHKITSFEN